MSRARDIADIHDGSTGITTLGTVTTGTFNGALSATTTGGGVMAVGTVSESSGTPTGHIIERGSNSNGEFIKYADGTLICLAETTGDTTRTFPSAFSSKCKIVATGVLNDTAFYVHDTLTTLESTYYITQTSKKSIIAIGQWY